ncbi:MAG: ISAs1 family transposase [Euryarchaeota archaeon]|nr:ISAs1 family transposase [Euryarchaeota archaeon]
MAHPDWVNKHKIPNSEIRCIREKYYLYAITSKWCQEKKRTKKVTLRQIGIIDKEFGLIPTGMSRKGKVPKGESKMKSDVLLETNFLDHFEVIEDPRLQRNQLYTVEEILLVTLVAVICGAEGWQDVENYGKSKIKYLRCYLPYECGIPSDDTVRRFFRAINPDCFKEIFSKWVQGIANVANAKVIAIDGKSNRRTFDGEGNMLHMVSAFASEARVVLAQEKVADKSNEITAIPLLLDLLDVKGHIVTIDAIGCQYAIANKIVDKGGDYIFSLKGNQGSLSEKVKVFMSTPSTQNTCLTSTDYDKGHGRLETRICFVSNEVEWLHKEHKNWKTIQCIIRIDSTREVTERGNKKITQETRYHISSLKKPTPQVALRAVRDHWGIENTLHWTLDMSFNEDYSRIRKENAPHVMAMLRHMALNILQQGKLQQKKHKRQSIKGLRKMCSWDNDTLSKFISKYHSQTESS